MGDMVLQRYLDVDVMEVYLAQTELLHRQVAENRAQPGDVPKPIGAFENLLGSYIISIKDGNATMNCPGFGTKNVKLGEFQVEAYKWREPSAANKYEFRSWGLEKMPTVGEAVTP